VDGEFEIPETPLGFSAGIAQFPEDIDTLDGLITMADAALYKAKREGKYRTELASAMESALNH
jgi:PleD family two-component response regulator